MPAGHQAKCNAESTSADLSFDQPTQSESVQQRKAGLLKKVREKKSKAEQASDGAGLSSIRSHFKASRRHSNSMAATATALDYNASSATVVVSSCGSVQVGDPSNVDLMRMLCEMSKKIDKLNDQVEELRGEMHDLRVENQTLKCELEQCRKKLEEVTSLATEAKFLASVAEKRTNNTEQYTRRNNVCILGVPEADHSGV